MTRRLASGWLSVLVLFLAAGLLWPAGELARVAWEGAGEVVFSGYNLRALTNTLLIGTGVALSATVLGFIVAYALEATTCWGRKGLRVLYLAPLFAPSVMPAIGLIYLVGSNGLVCQWELYGALGVFLGGLVFALPHAVLQVSVSLASRDDRLNDAARALGAGWWRRFVTVTLAQSRRGLMNAFLVTFVLTVTDFGVPKLLGGSFPMLATEIYSQAVGSQNFAVAAVLSLWLFVPSLIAFYFSSRLNKVRTGNGFAAVKVSPWRDWSVGAAAWAIVLAEVATVAVVIYGSFVTFWPYVPELTLANYEFRSSTYGIVPWVNSLKLALGVAVTETFVTFVGAYVSVRTPVVPWLKKAYAVLTSLPLCIPGTVLGLGYALTMGRLSVFSGAVGGMLLLVVNTLVHLYTVPNLTVTSALSAMNPQYETVGKSLGAGTMTTLRRVILPLSAPSLKEVFVYLFASAVTTISAVVFLYNPQTMVAAVAAIDLIDSGFISEGAAMSTLIFLSALAVRVVTLRR